MLDRIILTYVCCSDRGQHFPVQSDVARLIRYLLGPNEKFQNFSAITQSSLTTPSYVPWTQIIQLLLTCSLTFTSSYIHYRT